MFAVISTRLPGSFSDAESRIAGSHRPSSGNLRRGTHPFQKWQRQEVCDNERYHARWKTLVISFSRRPFLVSMPCWLRQWR